MPVGRLAGLLARVEDALLVLLLAVMVALAGGQILLRNAFDAGLFWGDPLLRVLVLWVGMVGAMAAARADRHITVDVLARLLPARARARARAFTDGCAAAVCAILAWHAARLVAAARANRRLLAGFRTCCEVAGVLGRKRRALAAHASQVTGVEGQARWPTLRDVSRGEFAACFDRDREFFQTTEVVAHA